MSAAPPWSKSGLLLAYYGDDFTGSTDVLQALAQVGVRTVLFLSPPSPEQLARFPGLQAFGIAGGSRTFSPERMQRELPPAFASLQSSGAPLIHYKICSTFDSTPTVGSVGQAIDLGRQIFGHHPTPLVVGAPALGRYVVFGNLFARSGLDSEPFRLDRHPTMSRHPVTPMDESDLRRILAQQTRVPVELVDVLKLDRGAGGLRDDLGTPAPVVLFDTLCETHLPVIGEAILELVDASPPLFCVGSSGLEYALVAAWRARNFLPEMAPPPLAQARPQILVVSGSCSPVTARQIERAVNSGFGSLTLDLRRLLDDAERSIEQQRLANQLVAVARTGRSVIISTRPGDRVVEASSEIRRDRLNQIIGQALGDLITVGLRELGVTRVAICGGDTSTHVARALGIESLEYLGPIAPGSPLCRVHAPGRPIDGQEAVFKGGQVGRDSFFSDVQAGGPVDRDRMGGF